MFKTGKEVVDFIAKEKVQIVDLRFMDFPGLWQHFTVPAHVIEEDTFRNGLGFDGSSIRGWQAINESRHARHARGRHRHPRPVH